MIRELFLSDFSLSSCVWQSTIFLVVGLVGSFILRHRSARAHQVLFLAMIAAVIVPIMSILVKHYELGMFVAEPVVIQSRAEDVGRVGNFGAPGIISTEDIEHKPGTIEKDLPRYACFRNYQIPLAFGRVVRVDYGKSDFSCPIASYICIRRSSAKAGTAFAVRKD